MSESQLYSNLRYLCDANFITFSALEKELHLSNGTISRWEKSIPSSDKLYLVANYFKYPMETLLYSFLDKSTIPNLLVENLITRTISNEIKWNYTRKTEENNIYYKVYDYLKLKGEESDNIEESYDELLVFYFTAQNKDIIIAKILASTVDYNSNYTIKENYYLFITDLYNNLSKQNCNIERLKILTKLIDDQTINEPTKKDLENFILNFIRSNNIDKIMYEPIPQHMNVDKLETNYIISPDGEYIYIDETNRSTTRSSISFYEKNKKFLGEFVRASIADSKFSDGTVGYKLKLFTIDEEKLVLYGCTSGYIGEGSRGTVQILKDAGFEFDENIIYKKNKFEFNKQKDSDT